MLELTALAEAAVPADTLRAMVAALLGHPRDDVDVITCEVDEVAYSLPSITTVARHWVHGLARTPAGETPYRLFVKHVQAFEHSPFFQFVPPPVRERAAASVPWRVEAAVYGSDLRDRLPAGLSMPRALGIFEGRPDRRVLWLEAVDETSGDPWDTARYIRSAHLLGRLAGSPAVAEVADVGGFTWSVRDYVEGRVAFQVLPALLDGPDLRPDAAEAFGLTTLERLRRAAPRLGRHAEELEALPLTASHGDASPNNLLAAGDHDVVLIDFGFWMAKQVGFDLGQLVAGDVQLGRLPRHDLHDLDDLCVAAYADGLAAEGRHVPVETLRRAHALQLLIFAGISSLPDPGMPQEQVRARGLLAELALDLVERTGG